jgi:exodeoxyribonuclease VIII
MQSLMVDLDTLGTPPDGAIVSIDACYFDKTSIGERFHRTVNLASAVRLGMSLDPATIIWWLRQDDRSLFATNGTLITDVLHRFTDFVRPDATVYGVATFDLAILGAAYKLAGSDKPWKHGNERCFRTICNLRGMPHHDRGAQSMVEHLWKMSSILNP